MRDAVFVAVVVTLVGAGCAALQNTPAQDYTWAMGRACDTTTMSMERVETDGRYWVRGASNVASLNSYFDCMKEQFKAHPYLDWLKAQKMAAAPSPPASVALAGERAV